MKYFLFVLSLFFGIGNVNASVGVALGASMWAKDGYPILFKKEQIRVFVCHQKTRGVDAELCAIEKCKAFYNIKSNDKATVSRNCREGGWSEKVGHSIIAIGAPGDNNYILSKALGDPTREEAMNYVKSNNFPIERATIVWDKWDDLGFE